LVAIDVAVDVGSGVELTMEPPARLMRWPLAGEVTTWLETWDR
jgi:hypothetical protein